MFACFHLRIWVCRCRLSSSLSYCDRAQSLEDIKVPGYILPKSWNKEGKARLVVYVKKTLDYEQLFDIESEEVQSIWIRAGFKNSCKIYFSHQYREHTNTLGNSIAAQRNVLRKQLNQWEEALEYGNPNADNEVHVMGDINLDSYKGRWLEPGYSLVTLARMVVEFCNSNNFTQVVKDITRAQFNSINNTANVSCIDHLYCNMKHRISPVSILSFGASDHNALSYVRYSKEPCPPPRTVRKRSYKTFDPVAFLSDMSKVDFTEVYYSQDVDESAKILTNKVVEVLDRHAPWIVYQQRKHYAPWISSEMVKLMEERDRCKNQAVRLANIEGRSASVQQVNLWKKYKRLRNSLNNKNGQEEIKYKRCKVNECKDNPGMVWSLAKS